MKDSAASWRRVELQDVAQIRSGLAKNSKRRTGRFFPYLRVANVRDGELDLSEVKLIEVEPGGEDRYLLYPGDVLLTEGNGNPELVGRGCVWSGQIERCLHQNHIFAVRPNTALVDPAFLAHVTSSSRARSYFLACTKGSTTLSSINATQLRCLPLLLPPLSEQRRISDAIGSWEVVERKLKALVSAKDGFQGRLRERLFARAMRLVEDEGSWSRVRLADVAYESRTRNAGYLDSTRVMGVSKVNGMEPMRERSIAADISRYKTVGPGSFAYNPMRLNIGSIAFWPGPGNVLVSPDYVVFGTDESRLSGRYLNHFRLTRAWQRHVDTTGAGSVRVRIYYEQLAAITMSLPPLEIQSRIVDLLDLVDREIRLLTRISGLLTRQRKAVTDALLAGDLHITPDNHLTRSDVHDHATTS